MKEYNLLILPGDGIGPEVSEGGVSILKKIATLFNHNFIFDYGLIGQVAIDKTGLALPEITLSKARKADAILYGAVGSKDSLSYSKSVCAEDGILNLRHDLGLFSNIRVIKANPALVNSSCVKKGIIKDVDILFFRELTGGIYSRTAKSRLEYGEIAVDNCVYSREEVRRIALLAFDAATSRKKKVTLIDKANVMDTSRLWREVVKEIAMKYPDVFVEYLFVDSAAMKVVSDPSSFDVILTENMFGDILTDLAGQVVNSIGMIPSVSNGFQTSLYEPIHGSAPDIAGKNIANPIASILSSSLLLRCSFNMDQEARIIELAVDSVLNEGWRTRDIVDDNTLEKYILGTKEITLKIEEAIDKIFRKIVFNKKEDINKEEKNTFVESAGSLDTSILDINFAQTSKSV